MSAHTPTLTDSRASIPWHGEPRYKQWEVAVLYPSGNREDYCFPKCSYSESAIMARAMDWADFNKAPAFAIRGEGRGTLYAGPVLNALGRPKDIEGALRAIAAGAAA